MPPRSAGLLLHRGTGPSLEVFIAHMGGPFWRRRPRAWSIPKGELEAGEDTLATALREFGEEIGTPAPAGTPELSAPAGTPELLGDFRQASGKVVTVWTLAAPGFTIEAVRSNTVSLELPRGSGHFIEVPEVDDARWVGLAEARQLVVAGQVAALDALAARI